MVFVLPNKEYCEEGVLPRQIKDAVYLGTVVRVLKKVTDLVENHY